MNIAEKRDYISRHLQFIEEDVVNTFFQKIHSLIKEKNIVVGFNSEGSQISAQQFLIELKEAEMQIKNENFFTIEEIEKESENW